MKRAVLISAILIVTLFIWHVLSPTREAPIYSFAQFREGLLHHPLHWSGRTVLIEGTIQMVGGNCPILCLTPTWTHSRCAPYRYCSDWEELRPPFGSKQRDTFLLLRPGNAAVVLSYDTGTTLIYNVLSATLSRLPSFIPLRLAPRNSIVYKIHVFSPPYCVFIGSLHFYKWRTGRCNAYGVLMRR